MGFCGKSGQEIGSGSFLVLDNARDGLLEFYECGESARVGFEDGCEREERWICLERNEIAGELCDGLGGLTGKTLACGLARGGMILRSCDLGASTLQDLGRGKEPTQEFVALGWQVREWQGRQ